MKVTITVREFARLTTSNVESTLDEATISQSDFDWLCRLSASFRSRGAQLLQVDNQQWLRLDNYVGVLEMPSGKCLEILPKNHEDSSCIENSRALLCQMIQTALDLPSRNVGTADLALFNAPLSEWVIQQFLLTLDKLVKRGLRFDYLRIEEEQRFLRGQLNISRQLRQPSGKQHLFQIRHDVFLPDRPENRLLKSAVELVAAYTQDARSWRIAHELLGIMADIPSSQRIKDDFKRWRHNRLMAHYEPVRPWCELVLRQQMPLAVSGDWHGISMLFPMEKLFERYVEASLRCNLPGDVRLTSQSSSQYLCTHKDRNFFQLRPDMLLIHQDKRWILDTKWKRIDSSDIVNNYGLNQSDFYQMYAYGHNYLGENGDIILIYPRTKKFPDPLLPFNFSDSLRLWVLPFDLDKRLLIEPAPALLPHDPSKDDVQRQDSNLLSQLFVE